MAPDAQSTSGDVTGLLKVWSEGYESAYDRLIPLGYGELHRMAHATWGRNAATSPCSAPG